MNFECRRCGKCCSNYLPITEEEEKVIRKYMIKHNLKENKKLFALSYYELCPFLNSKNECDVYEVRPSICRYYTCDNFNNHQFPEEFMDDLRVNGNDRELVNMRETFFNSYIGGN